MEFKKLSDVEVVEAVGDAANVLIEENGVIKKAPKTEVGGKGGGVEYDAIIDVGTQPTTFSADSAMLISGGYENIKAKLEAGDKPNILLRHNYVYAGDTYNTTYEVTSVTLYPARNYVYMYAYIANAYMGFGTPQHAHLLTIKLDQNNTILSFGYHHP